MTKIVWYETKMTSNTTPTPYIVSASSEYSSTYGAWKAFNGSISPDNGWASANTKTGWIQFDFGVNTKVRELLLKDRNNTPDIVDMPIEFNLQGSNDGMTFENIKDFKTSNDWKMDEVRVFKLDEVVNYKVYRINIIKSGGSRAYICIGQIKFGYSPKMMILKNPATNQHYSLAEKTLIPLSDISDKNMILHGIEAGKEIQLDEPFTIIRRITENEDGTQEIVDETVESFSVYDYISEKPIALIYTESDEDITITTTTPPFTLYDEFGDEVEVLYYTDDETVTEADLILEANWSPIDELDGDFEVITWTDEPQETAQGVLEMTAIPKPQFIKLTNPKRLYRYLESILTSDSSTTYRFDKSTRYLLSNNSKDWYVWDKYTQAFVKVDASTHEFITKNGMTDEDINNITDEQWKTWKGDYVGIGIFLEDNPRDTIVSVVESVSYSDYLPRHSTQVEKGNFYILNTTAKIDLELNGNVLKGVLSDDDLTRVQYRVLVNSEPYYPSDGNFTQLSDSPTNIELVIPSKDIIMDDWNTVKVEFRDFYRTVDYWQTQFIGTYSGLMFKDIHGDYYSSEIGEVLKYLDFGIIIAGQTTIEHEIILKNQYGYDVENIYLYANTSEFPQGMTIEFSENLSPFLPQHELRLARVLKNNEEYSFFVRLKTELGSTPNANGSFDIIVRADKVV